MRGRALQFATAATRRSRSRARVGARRLGGDDGLGGRAVRASCATATSTSDSADSTSATWCRRSGARRRAGRSRSPTARRASRSSGSAAHVDPILAAARAALDRRAVAAHARAVQIVGGRLGALPVFWLARRHLGIGARPPRCSRSRTSRIRGSRGRRWTRSTRSRSRFRSSCSASGSSTPIDLRRSPSAPCSLLSDRRARWASRSRRSGVWYALRARAPAGAASVIAVLGVGWTLIALYRRRAGFLGRLERLLRSIRRRWGIAGGSRADRTDRSRARSWLRWASGARFRVHRPDRGTRLPGPSCWRPGLAPSRLPQVLVNLVANELGADQSAASTTLPAILPFIFAAIAVGLARLSPQGRRVVARSSFS